MEHVITLNLACKTSEISKTAGDRGAQLSLASQMRATAASSVRTQLYLPLPKHGGHTRISNRIGRALTWVTPPQVLYRLSCRRLG